MRIVIAGAGNVGTHLVKMFTDNNHDVVIIDSNRDNLHEIASHYDVMTVFGTASSRQILEEAEIGKAKLFIAVSNYQETNILSAILAKKLGAKQTVARIDNSEYLVEDNEQMLRDLGVDILIYPEILASEEIYNHLKQPGILKTISFASGKLNLYTIRITEKSDLVNKNLSDIAQLFPGVVARIVAIVRESDTIIPRGKDTILLNDILYIITDDKGRTIVSSIIGEHEHDIKNVMILGGSRIGVKVAKLLEKHCYVKLFEKLRDKSFEIADMLKDTLVLNSEARTADFLLDEGIGKTDAFIAVAGNSEINMLSCMLAKKLGVKNTFAEIENIDYFDLAKSSEIDYVVNKKLIAASKIFALVIDAEVLSIQYFTDTQAEILEFVVHNSSKVIRKPIKDLDFPEQAIIGGIVRQEMPFIAVGDTQLLPDDKVVVFCLPGFSSKIAKWFK
ncbi:MAG: Trk system potassium transporter TrkA [Bacteroidales bacterium]|nr:Trk system potassium transporter TrkA [Bacteroidales bacterium]